MEKYKSERASERERRVFVIQVAKMILYITSESLSVHKSEREMEERRKRVSLLCARGDFIAFLYTT
jgi:hypothetical protein